MSSFDCGVAPLNEYLRKYALLNHQNRSARIYVAIRREKPAGFYTLASGSVGRNEVPSRGVQGLGSYPVPVTLLARLAVDKAERGRGLGAALLRDALRRASQASELVGSRAIVTHAKDEAAKAFYKRFDFAPPPLHEFQ